MVFNPNDKFQNIFFDGGVFAKDEPVCFKEMEPNNLKKEADKILKKYVDIAETKINDIDNLKPQNNDYNQSDGKHGAPLVIEVLLSTFKSLFAEDKKKS